MEELYILVPMNMNRSYQDAKPIFNLEKETSEPETESHMDTKPGAQGAAGLQQAVVWPAFCNPPASQPRGKMKDASVWSSRMLRIYCLWCILGYSAAQVPMGPGSMQPYAGGQRRRSYGVVREPAQGFFVTGSSLKDMNGVYKRVETVPTRIKHTFQLAYRKWPWREPDNLEGWMIALVGAPEEGAGYKAVGGKSSEWVIIDSEGRDRFGHEGETVIPGAGTRWQHVHRDVKEQGGAGEASAVALEDDEDELPWQVIFIGDENMVERLRHGHRHYMHVVQQAIGGGTCEQRPGGCAEEACPFDDMPPVLDAEQAFDDGDYARAAEIFGDELLKQCANCPSHGEYRKFPKWREATLRVLLARSLRRARKLDEALDVLDPVLKRIMPRYKDAWLELGKLMLDAGRPDVALSAFTNLLKLDRSYPGLVGWLVRARAMEERSALAADEARKQQQQQQQQALPPGQTDTQHHQESNPHAPDSGRGDVRAAPLLSLTAEEKQVLDKSMEAAGISPLPAKLWYVVDHYAVLGVAADFGIEDLKKAYKKMSRITHPDKNKGSNLGFQAVAAAYQVLSEEDKREFYDQAQDIQREVLSDGSEGPSFWDQMRKEYFPEQFHYEPFGDPYESKRNHIERKRQQTKPAPNEADIPPGSYLTSCLGCRVVNERRLLCSHCNNGRGQLLEASILFKECSHLEWIGNQAGKLMCEPKPQDALPPPESETPPADVKEDL